METTHPDVIPMIAYQDGPAAMDWLARAFGFTERARYRAEDLEGHRWMFMHSVRPIHIAAPARERQ